MEDRTIRVDREFNNQIEEIIKERLKRLIDSKKISSREITSMIPKHNSWKRMKEDMINRKFK